MTAGRLQSQALCAMPFAPSSMMQQFQMMMMPMMQHMMPMFKQGNEQDIVRMDFEPRVRKRSQAMLADAASRTDSDLESVSARHDLSGRDEQLRRAVTFDMDMDMEAWPARRHLRL